MFIYVLFVCNQKQDKYNRIENMQLIKIFFTIILYLGKNIGLYTFSHFWQFLFTYIIIFYYNDKYIVHHFI